MGLYILTHRQIPNWNTKFWTPIHMSLLPNPDVKLQVKDYYPKMAELNQMYNELSALYYIWKNDNDPIKGATQYRLVPKLTETEITNILKTHKFIAFMYTNMGDLAGQFKMHHDKKGGLWEIILEAVRESGIDEALVERWQHTYYLFARNIFITTKEYFDEYSEWMFNIIFKIQDKLGIKNPADAYEWAKNARPDDPDYQIRSFGGIAERLQTLYMMSKIDLNDIYKDVYIPEYEVTAEQVKQISYSNKQYDYIIVGAGLYGSIFAYEQTRRGKKCLVIDKRDHIGGNCYSENISEIDVHKYGPHIFHTNNKMVWDYIQQFGEFQNFTLTTIADYKGQLYNLPFNMNTFTRIWSDVKTPEQAINRIAEQTAPYTDIEPRNLEEQALKLVGPDIYNTLIKGYSEKQWGRPATDIPAFVIRRLPLRFTFNNNYFNDQYQGIPVDGYTSLFERMLSGIDVVLNENFLDKRQYYEEMGNRILYTGNIDGWFDYKLGHLEYRSLKFYHNILPETNNFQGNAIFNYTSIKVPYTRIVEHKHFNKKFANTPGTVITYEFPVDWNENSEPYYPINNDRNAKLFEQYKHLAEQYDNISFGGRLGDYKYYDMDKTIEAVLNHKWLKDD